MSAIHIWGLKCTNRAYVGLFWAPGVGPRVRAGSVSNWCFELGNLFRSCCESKQPSLQQTMS